MKTTTAKRLKIAIDVDGCLISHFHGSKPVARVEVMAMLIALSKYHDVFVWSGGGADYAKQVVRDLKLTDRCEGVDKLENDGSFDVCFDDKVVFLAKTNIQI